MPSLTLSLPILLLMTMPFSGHTQSQTIDCTQDSTDYLALAKMLDTLGVHNMYILDIMLPYTVLSHTKKRDCFCDLLIYARVFDFMLEKGLDLNYHIGQNPPVNNSTNIPTTLAQINHNNRYHTFSHFLKIKQEYEKSVLQRYKKDKNRLLTADVNNILQYHIHAYPGTLKDILLGRYSHLTSKKLQAEMDEIFGEPGGKH